MVEGFPMMKKKSSVVGLRSSANHFVHLPRTEDR
jgi:hypothetical protein